jgi:lipopolysaccharide transport protein LptA
MPSCVNRHHGITALAVLMLGVAAAMAAAPRAAATRGTTSMTFDGDSSEVNGSDGSITTVNATLAEVGALGAVVKSVTADNIRTSALDQRDQTIECTGHVVFTTREGQLTGESATIKIARGSIVQAVITGKPASFEEQSQEVTVERRLHAQTDEIRYDATAATLTFTGGVLLRIEAVGELRGYRANYSFATHRARIEKGNDERSRGTLWRKPQGSSTTP